jgi:hypothetical protein
VNRTAIVMSSNGVDAGAHGYLVELLKFFGIPWRTASRELWCEDRPRDVAGEYCVLSPMELFGRELKGREDGTLPPLARNAHSLYLFGGGDKGLIESAIRSVSGGAQDGLVPLERDGMTVSIASAHADVCGAMSGLQIETTARFSDHALKISGAERQVHRLISVGDGELFARLELEGVSVFLDPCPEPIDISRPVQKAFFDVRDHFCQSVPITMYLRFAFGGCAWGPIENGACLIVDDPVLRPRYGCVEYGRIAELCAEHRFACTFAFIPWNWRRSRAPVVELFRRNPDLLSICYHGTDHTAGEFGSKSAVLLNAAAKLARSRMTEHEHLTRLSAEPIMVFPQGIFSAEAASVLKHNAFAGAVNTTVLPQHAAARTPIADTWRPAITSYSGFPIYTRRYVSQGLGNFAFDILLGKPALIVTHHQDFLDRGAEIASFIDSLNSLRTKLTWRPLGEVLRRGHAQRLLPEGVLEVRLFAYEAALENRGGGAQAFLLTRPGQECGDLETVEVGGEKLVFAPSGEDLRIPATIPPSERLSVRLTFKDIYGAARAPRGALMRAKVAVRRILSEGRDEAFARAPRLVGAMLAVRGYLRRRYAARD